EAGTAVAEVVAYPGAVDELTKEEDRLVPRDKFRTSLYQAEEEGLAQRKKVRAGEELAFDIPDFYVEFVPDSPGGRTGKAYYRFTGKVNRF
ncbi:hypothetical protein ABTO84_19195, partial [Acinetobacter baumannii]